MDYQDCIKFANENPVCFYAPGEPQTAKMMRVAGEVEFLEDIALKAKLFEERPFLKAIGAGGPGDHLLVIFRVYTGEPHFWTVEDNSCAFWKTFTKTTYSVIR